MSALGEFERILAEQTARLQKDACDCGCPSYCHADAGSRLCQSCGPCYELRGVGKIFNEKFDSFLKDQWKLGRAK